MTPRAHLGLAVLLTLTFATPGVGLAQWWKEPPDSRLDLKLVDPSGQTAARLRWDEGSVDVRASVTADNAPLGTAERTRAVEAARQRAASKLGELVESLAIDGATPLKDAIVADPGLGTGLQARLRGAVLVSETATDLPEGGARAEVALALRLRGPGSVTEPAAAWSASRPVHPYRADPSFRVGEAFTGLIVEASDTDFSPALAPRLIEESSGHVVFGPQMVHSTALSQQGPVGYAVRMREARQAGRVGANPLVVRATGAGGTRKGDLVLSRKDADRVLAADRAGRFFDRAAVVIVLGRQARELAAQPGRRYALVIGIDDYPTAVPGGGAGLKQAVRDARALAQLLAQAEGFAPDSITLLDDAGATRDGIIEALRTLRGRVTDEDSVVIFFAGHGAAGLGADGRFHHYLLPRDGQLADLAGTALMDDRLEELIGLLPVRQVVVLIDAGYAGAASGKARARGLANPSAPPPPTPPPPLIEPGAGRVVIAASQPDQPALEDDQRGGLFTSFMVEGLRGAADPDADGAVTVYELYQYVAPRLREYARRRYRVEQTPVLDVRGKSGEIVLIRKR